MLKIWLTAFHRDQLLDRSVFTLYIQPVQEIIRKHGFLYHMYADDIQVYAEFDPCSQTDVGQTLQRLSNCVKDIQNWMFVNKLKLKPGQNRIHNLCISCPSSKASARRIASWWPHHITFGLHKATWLCSRQANVHVWTKLRMCQSLLISIPETSVEYENLLIRTHVTLLLDLLLHPDWTIVIHCIMAWQGKI